MLTEQVNFGIFALVGVIMLVLAGTSFGYLLLLKNKSRASWLLMWFFLGVICSAIATILTNSGTSWAKAFAPAQDALLILGGIFLVQLAYGYPVNDQPREARLVTGVYLALALFALVYALYFAARYLASLPLQVEESEAYYLLTPLVVALLAGLFFRRFYHWRKRSAPGASSQLPAGPGSALPDIQLSRQAASTLRDFGFAMLLGMIPVVVTVLPRGLLGLPGSFLFNFGVVLAISALMLVYLSHAPDPTTISARLVGISLATVMLILGLAAIWVILDTPGSQVSSTVLTFIGLVLASSLFILLVFPLFFRYTLLQPLDRLLAGVRRANEGDLETQVPVQFDDEVGFLTKSFNRMTCTLNEKSQALQVATANLEQQIAARTAELEGANAQLRLEDERRQAAQLQLDRQLRYEQALSQCAVLLSVDVATPEGEYELLSQALASLREAAGASHVQAFQNFSDPEAGFCSRMVAESAAAGMPLHLHDPQAQKIPWSQVPAPNQQALERGEPVGGPVDQVFASTPELLESLQRDGIRSVLFFPIHVDGRWWGYIGFDDTEPTREWDPQELPLLETAAGVLASFLLRGEKERSLARQHIYQRALSRCSRVLLRSAATKSERENLLNEALAHLMEAVEASRAYIFQNRLDPLEGESMGALAESVAPGVVQHRSVPVNQNFPWAELPPEMYATLRDRRPFGGPVEYAMTSKPALKDAFLQQQPPLLSLQLFPIYLDDVWWGFIGFDDCLQPRIWDEGEIQLLRTGAEMISSVLLRWQREDSNLAQAQAQQALARSSQRLLQPAASASERQAALAQALGFLVEAANASRGYLFKNFEHPQDGFSMQMLAEACDPGAEAHLGGPFAGHVPWALVVPETRILLEQGQTTSGPVEQVLAGSPEIQDALDSDPALSVQLFPIYFGDRWWGMLGFDDFETLRAWGDQETMLLSTGAEIFSQTLQRWEAEDELQRTLNALEERVQQRTRQLLLANTRLMEEIEEREAAQHSLKNQLKLESGLAGISEGLMAATDLGTAINQGLAGLGELIQASRISLILLAERQEFVITDVFSWQKPDIPAFSQEEAQVLTTTFSWSTSQLARHLPVYIHAAQDLPEEALHEWTYLQEKRTDSLLLFPLVAQNQLIGVLACENIGFTGELFADVRRMLEVAAGILSSALAHQQLLDDLELKINTRTRELAALYDLAILGGQSAQLSDILQPMLSRILEITSSEAACLHLLEGDTLRLEVHLGFTAGQMVRRKEILLSPAIKDWLAQADVLVANRPQAQAIPQPEIFSLADFAQMRLVRLSGRDQFHGILCCYRRENIPYSPHQSSTLAAIGEQLGVIIENHHLRMEAEALASLRERQRLARELHDSVSQSLYSLTLFARAGRDALESGDLETLAQSLLEVEENSKHALREMRLLLYQLRSEAIEEGLRQALEDRFQMIEHRLGIQTELDFDSSLQLDPVIEQELFGLINEALNNAVKHASPSQVLVALKRSAAGLELLVADNGEGFTPQKASAGIGLSSMHERAELLGGALEIYSQPGEGTQVRLVLPAGRVETGG